MSRYALTAPARADIAEIWSYIAADSVEAADRVEQAIFDACKLLGMNPLAGSTRHGSTSRSLRFWTVARFPNYVVVYRPETVPVRVIAILHGKRSLAKILKRRS